MGLNIFEGSRRIAKVVAALVAIAAGIVTWAVNEQTTALSYSVRAFGAAPLRIAACQYNSSSATEHAYKTLDGEEVRIEICFEPNKADTGDMLIPYADAGDGRVWMGDRFDPKVEAYTKAVVSAFHVPDGDAAYAHAQDTLHLFEQCGWAILAVGIGFVGVLLMSKIVGWIARGFLGVPVGHDFRA